MVAQAQLPFDYIEDNNNTKLTSHAGLPLYIEMALASGINEQIKNHLKIKHQGWSDEQIIISLILLNLAGGTCIDDIDALNSDEGLSIILLKAQTYGMKRKERRAYEKRWRKGKNRSFPCISALRRYLEIFHDKAEENKRVPGKAFIPKPNKNLKGLANIGRVLLEFAQRHHPCDTATLDQDATLSATHKSTAYYCYEKYKAYQPFNTYWHEQGLLVGSEFRDGNVPAGFEQLRMLEESLENLPEGVKKVYVRSDSAGYQQNILNYCAQGKSKRFGIIDFAISVRSSQSFKAAVLAVTEKDWNPIYKEDNGQRIKTDQEWAEVCFVPAWTVKRKDSPVYRYIAIREKMIVQETLEGIEPIQQELPFQTLSINQKHYKIFGLVTNRDIPGNDLINWHRKRCGDSEKVHSIEKTDLAGGQFPSKYFGANAAWWQIMVMSFNLNVLMKLLVFPKALKTKKMKAIRLHLINVAGRIIQHSRKLFMKVAGGSEMLDRVCDIRARIKALSKPPPALKHTN